MKRIALFASGSGTNVENIISYFKNNNDVIISLILCNNPSAYVLERAKNHSIPSILFTNKELNETNIIIETLTENSIDFIVLAGFMRKIPSTIIEKYTNKIINIHPALLPKYGGKGMYGMHVHEAIVEAKEIESGITIHYVNENYDEGSIIFQAKCSVEENDTPDDVANKVHQLEYNYFPSIIEQVINQ